MSDAVWVVALTILGLASGYLAGTVATRILAARDDVAAPVPAWAPVAAAVVTAPVFVVTGQVIGATWVLPAYLAFVVVTVTATITDLHCRLIPNRVNFPGLVVAGGLLVPGALIDGSGASLVRAIVGAAIFYAVLYVLWLLSAGRAMGGGDVKLTPLLGLFTAYLGWDVFMVGIFMGVLIGGLAALVLVVGRMARLRDHFAYGPALVLGAWIAIARGAEIWAWYVA